MPKDWAIERFLIPISFAPDIRYKGVEDIRFTPGWAKTKGEEYWSYAFLWYLDGTVEMNPSIVERNLKAYYTGLANVNIDSARRSTIGGKLKPAKTSFQAIQTKKGDLKTFSGTVEMLDYMQLKTITLNCMVHVRSCPEDKKTIVFYELSPQPYTHSVWLDLDKLWLDFACKK
ncbi:MAG: hypothetical protein WCF67_04565 [Chitinophagaceae bacterium]